MKYHFKILKIVLATIVLFSALLFGGTLFVFADHAEDAASQMIVAVEELSLAQEDELEAHRALGVAQKEEALAREALRLAETALALAESAFAVLAPADAGYNAAAQEVQIKTGTRDAENKYLIEVAIPARIFAQDALADAKRVVKEREIAARQAERTAAQAEASDAVGSYYSQRGEEFSATFSQGESDPESLTTDLVGVAESCLKAAAVNASAAAAVRLLGLTGASSAGGTGALGTTASLSLISVPINDLIGNTIAGANAATELTHAIQKTSVEPFLDTLAYATAQCALDQLTQSTINWIKGGFEGSPKYAVDTNQLFSDYAGELANDFARQIRGLAVCDFTPNFKDDLANAIELSPHKRNGFTDKVSCPFGSGQFINFSAQDFSNNFQRGGWKAFEASLSDQGNPFGVTIVTNRELALRQNKEFDQKKQKLSWSNGFADIVNTTDCQYPAPDENGDWDIQSVVEDPATPPETKKYYEDRYCKTTTPGKILGDQLSKSLGINSDRLGFADNMNKIIAALFQELADQATKETFNNLNNVFGNPTN